MLDKDEDVPMTIIRQSGFDGGFANKLANE